jgi:perosamine synthetase
MVGFKYKMSNLQAAIGCAQMERIDELIAAKRRIFTYYAERLHDLPLRMNPEPGGVKNGYWMPSRFELNIFINYIKMTLK